MAKYIIINVLQNLIIVSNYSPGEMIDQWMIEQMNKDNRFHVDCVLYRQHLT